MRKSNGQEIRSYYVSPARRWIMVWMFAPFLLMAAAFLFTPEYGVGIALMLILLPVSLLGHWVVSYARLILSPSGILCRQVGCTVETTWDNIAAVRLDRGREGLVSELPLSGKGAKRLAAMRNTGMRGVPLYDERQRAALAEGLFMPIAPFAYAIRNGSMIADIEQWAPEVAAMIRQELGQALEDEAERRKTPATSKERRARWIVALIILGTLGVAIGSSFLDPEDEKKVSHAVHGLAVSVFALGAFAGFLSRWQRRSWWIAALFLVLAVVLALWAVDIWAAALGA
jgi:hypothetical protein